MIRTAARTMMMTAALTWLTPTCARGQEPTPASQADVDAGVRAFLAGDYGQAVDRLRPIAEHWTAPVDGTATFFMSMAYAEGLGVRRDAVRACALRVRALAITRPLALALERLNTHAMAAFSPEQLAECLMRSAAGFDLEFAHTTVTLAPGRWVGLDLSAPDAAIMATITTPAGEWRHTVTGVSPGLRVMPVRHTALQVGGHSPGRRDFLELFAWMPNEPSGWRLHWIVREVLDEDLVDVLTEQVMTTAASEPPVLDRGALERLARVHVGASGEAEWEIRRGAQTRTDIIPPHAERLEIAAEARARREAEASVDWKRNDNAFRAPRFTYTPAAAGGCRAVFVYAWSADRMESITLDIRAPLPPGVSAVFDLASGAPVAVTTTVFESPQGQPGYCSDVSIDDGRLRATWRAVRGRLTVTRSAEGIRVSQPGMSRVVIDIDQAEFASDTGGRLKVGAIHAEAPVEQTGSRVQVIP